MYSCERIAVEHYGFRPDDNVVLGDPIDEFVLVQRRVKSMRLMLSPADATVTTLRAATDLNDMIFKDDRFSFPNTLGCRSTSLAGLTTDTGNVCGEGTFLFFVGK